MITGCNHLVATSQICTNAADIKFTFTQQEKDIKINVHVLKDFKNLTDQYSYHIHEAPMTGDCSTTKLHYDPFKKNPNGNSPAYKCIKEKLENCEIGDLSGKFGKLLAKKRDYTFIDNTNYKVSDLENKSIVIHDWNKTRIACANIMVHKDTKKHYIRNIINKVGTSYKIWDKLTNLF